MAERRAQRSPWLAVPAADYEGHMASPNVRQLQLMSRVFGELLREFEPRSVGIVGVATGNGLERIDPARVRRVVGIDINPEYLVIARERHGARIPGLELRCTDAARARIAPRSLDLVYAALIFEYVDPAVLVPRIASWLRPDGVLAAFLQLPVAGHGKVSETPFRGVRVLEPVIHLVEPARFREIALASGLAEIRSRTRGPKAGKRFFLGLYRRES